MLRWSKGEQAGQDTATAQQEKLDVLKAIVGQHVATLIENGSMTLGADLLGASSVSAEGKMSIDYHKNLPAKMEFRVVVNINYDTQEDSGEEAPGA